MLIKQVHSSHCYHALTLLLLSGRDVGWLGFLSGNRLASRAVSSQTN